MRQCLHIIMLLTIGLTSSVSAGAMKLEMITLNYRSVDDIIPIIRPLLAEGGTVTGSGDQLILKTTPDNLAEVRQVLSSIDRAPRRLLITVTQDIQGEINRREHGLSGDYREGDVSLSAGDTRGTRRGVTITAGDEDENNIRYRNLSTRSNLDDSNTFQVQTLEGKAAFVQSGQQVPIANRNTYVTHGNIVVQDTIDYHDVSSGFYVLPRLSGDRVTLHVSPKLSRVQPNQAAIFEVQNAETTVSGRLGEWLQIGGIVQHFRRSNGEILGSTRQTGQEQRSIFVKVEEHL